jgi:hypothetical protein
VDERYKEDVAGPPTLFTVNGTPKQKYTAWAFPDPLTHRDIKPDYLQPSAFDSICKRFKLVREDLEITLVREVKSIISELMRPDYVSDSGGMDDDSVKKKQDDDSVKIDDWTQKTWSIIYHVTRPVEELDTKL